MRIKDTQQLMDAQRRLGWLLEENPGEALREARLLAGAGPVKAQVRFLRASILIDGGSTTGESEVVREGIAILRRLKRARPGATDVSYNLANGVAALANLADWSSPAGYVLTHGERREARLLYRELAASGAEEKLRAQALVNLGNSLDQAYRWVEAYDCWVGALSNDPKNAVAALSITRMLQRRCRQFRVHPRVQHRVENFYARYVKRHASEIGVRAGREAAEEARSLLVNGPSWRPRKNISDDFARFVAEHRLALVGTVEGVDFRKKRWDDVYIGGISEKLDAGDGVPSIFAMINQLKADYCTARWLAYAADNSPYVPGSPGHPVPKTALYMDTLDYAVYGTAPSMLVLAQRAAIDVLDRVAICGNEFFGIGDKPNDVHFRYFWRDGRGTGSWRTQFETELSTWNPGIIALGELASDLTEGSPLAAKSDLRNTSTHRFCVLHDEGATPSRPSPAIRHYEYEAFRDETIQSLQMVRSAILYLVNAIEWHEAQAPRSGVRPSQFVPSHDYIRGD